MSEIATTWEEVCAHPALRDLPFKIELNRFNQIVMAPAHALHSRLQTRIASHLQRLLPAGEAVVELAMQTSDNVKVPDVVWASAAMVRRHGRAAVWPAAPEICVEVRSASNTDEEMAAKRRLYFERGAREVWSCDMAGAMQFFVADPVRAEGEPARASKLCPRFPRRVKLGA